MHISGETVTALMRAVRSLNDAQLPDDTPLFAGVDAGGRPLCPILINDDHEPDNPMTVGHLKAIFEPFSVWL